MTFVVSLIGYLPPPRYDAVVWESVKIEESPAPTGPWTQIDAQTLTPADTDATMPQVRNFTTGLATLADGWYRVTFLDAFAGQSEPSDPERNSASEEPLPPSPDEIRNGSPLLRQKYPLPPTNPYATADLRNLVYQATALVQANTWRLIDPTLGCSAPETEVCELVPDALVPIAIQAVSRMAERLEVTTEPAFAAQVATGRRLRGFSAGPYSESYFAPGEFARRGASQGRPPMDTDDALDTALWALATEAARDYFVWRATGVAPPVGKVSTFDYRKESAGYTAGMSRGRRGYGPDGF